MSLSDILNKGAQKTSTFYRLPDSKKKISVFGSPAFVKDMCEMLDVLVHSPTALKLLNFYADFTPPRTIEGWENKPLDNGRNLPDRIQVAYNKDRPESKYGFLTLLPHEIRHNYNMPRPKSYILHAVAYAINEVDAHAIGALVALELEQYLAKQNTPYADNIRAQLNKEPDNTYFKELYAKTKGTEKERKAQTVTQYVLDYAQYSPPGTDKTFAEMCYKSCLERDTTKTAGGWKQGTEIVLKLMENRLLGKTLPDLPDLKGRKKLPDEKNIIRKELDGFAKKLMKGTYMTDLLPYGKNIAADKLLQTAVPSLYKHLKDIGVLDLVPPHPHPTMRTPFYR